MLFPKKEKETSIPKKKTSAEIDAEITGYLTELQRLLDREKTACQAHREALAHQDAIHTNPRVGGIMTETEIAAHEKTVRQLAIRAAMAACEVDEYQKQHGDILRLTQELENAHRDEQISLAEDRVERVKQLCKALLAASADVARVDAEIKSALEDAYMIYPVPLKDRDGSAVVEAGCGLPRDLGYAPGTFRSVTGGPGSNLYAAMRLVIARWHPELLPDDDPVLPLLEQVAKLGYATGMVLYASR